MKRIAILLTGICFAVTALAQTDTTKQEKTDTIVVGSMIIVKKGDGKSSDDNDRVEIHTRRKHHRRSNVTTNWLILDLGINRFDDKTDYSKASIQDPATGFAPGADKDWFKLRNGKSINVNIWFFMQELNVIKHVVNLKYGLGVELHNYHYSRNVKYQFQPTKVILDQSTSYSKNKLAADYLTAPIMLNFNFTPDRKHGFGFSAGVSAGYLYSSRQKTKTEANGKQKVWDDFDLRPWKISYVGELQLGYVKLYGSLATKSMFEKGLDQTPYNIGLRFSN
jgi:hypothetical protein